MESFRDHIKGTQIELEDCFRISEGTCKLKNNVFSITAQERIKAQNSEDVSKNYKYTNNGDSKRPWTREEDLQLLIAHQKHHNNWNNVAQTIVGRSNNSVKNRFYSIFRRVNNRIKKMDFAYLSKFEFVETSYIVSLIQKYISKPNPIKEHPEKRGKNYIYSLIKGLSKEELMKYNNGLKKSSESTTMKDLWFKINSQSHDEENSLKEIGSYDILSILPISNKSLKSLNKLSRALALRNYQTHIACRR